MAAAVLLLVAAAGAQARSGAEAALGRSLSHLVALRGGPPGAIAVVQGGSRLSIVRAGVANTRTGARIAADDHLRIASVSKAFSGAVALRFVQQGVLSLDDTIAQRLPGLPAAWGQVTLGEALHHTSGLPEFVTDPDYQARLTQHPRQPTAPTDLVAFVFDKPLQFPPGSQYHYADTDNVVVGLFVQAATGLSYEQGLSARVLDPLGLRETSLPTGWRMPAPFARGYEGGDDVSEIANPTLAWATGGMVSSPLDLNRFIRSYAGGRLFAGSTRTAQLAFVPGTSGPPGPGANEAGLGIFRYRTRCGVVYGHTGNIIGYTAFIAATPDGRSSAVVLATSQISPELDPAIYAVLRRAFGQAVCAATAR